MRAGDLILIIKSPWDTRGLFGYQNGDIGLIIDVYPDPNPISLPSLRVFIFVSEKIITIPLLYAEKIGE